LRDRAVSRVIIKRNRVAPDMYRTGERVGMSVIGGVGGRKEDHPVEFGHIAGAALTDVGIPQLEVAAPGRIPVAIEVEQQVEPAVKLESRMIIEVGVDLKVAARPDLMDPTAF